MNNFRSARDEFMEIENRWRLLSSREAILAKREQDVRAKEEEIRQFMNANHSMSMVSMAKPMRTPTQISKPHGPQWTPPAQHKHHYRNHSKKAPREDKDYSQFAASKS